MSKQAKREYDKKYYKEKKEKIKKYYKDNKEMIAEQGKKYREDNKEKIAEQMKKYYKENKEKIAKQGKKYREDNKEKIEKQGKKYREDNKKQINERGKKYREDNKEKIAERKKKYQEDNKEKIAERKKKYQEDNKEKIADREKKYREDNKEMIAERMKKYREDKYENRMGTNEACSLFLGVHVAERVLSKVFKDVKIMPRNNPGYDFICNKGKKIDVKSSTRRHAYGGWAFTINKNTVADFFLCIAFDDRDNLNPQHLWLLPSDLINHLFGIKITDRTIEKWNEYKLDVENVIECCEEIKISKHNIQNTAQTQHG